MSKGVKTTTNYLIECVELTLNILNTETTETTKNTVVKTCADLEGFVNAMYVTDQLNDLERDIFKEIIYSLEETLG